MLRIAFTDLRGRTRRLAGMAMAVVLGVSFLVGTIVLGDTIAATFDDLFSDTTSGTDVVVRSESPLASSLEADAVRRPIDTALLDSISAIEGVAVAEAQVVGYGQILDADGDPVGGNGPPRLAGSWITTAELNPYQLAEGRPPRAPDEVVVNRGAADAAGLSVGDRTIVQLPDPVEVTVVGIATFGGADGLGQTTMTAFTLDAARDLVLRESQAVSSILVMAEDGNTADDLRDRLTAVLPAGVEAVTGDELIEERLDSLDFIGMVRTFLVVFALIALVVAALSIGNTFSITVAQRTRELALLRAVGASSRQVRRLVRLEALIVGAAASLVGVCAGLGVAAGLKGVFAGFGLGLPAGGLTVRPQVVALGIVVGLVTVLVATRSPARRAAGVAPLEALRAASTDDAPVTRRRAISAGAMVVTGAGLAVSGLAGGVALVGAGSLLFVVGFLLLAPITLAHFASAAGSLLRRLRGIDGALAEQNVQRQPRRAASTATALTIGVTVVAAVTVLASSMASQLEGDVADGLGDADLAIATPAFGGGVLSVGILPDLEAVAEVDETVAVAPATVVVDGDEILAAATDVATAAQVLDVSVADGTLDGLSQDDLVVTETRADDEGWAVGSSVEVTFPDGVTTPMTVAAVVHETGLLAGMVLPTDTWFTHVAQPAFANVFMTLADGVDLDQGRSAITDIARRYSGDVQDREEVAAGASAGVDMLLGLVYVMLALAILISLLGIANALSLAVHERRQEIGLLRAVGQTRRQARRVLRLESTVVAAFGTTTGVVLGAAIGSLLFAAAGDGNAVVVPWGMLAIVLTVGVGVGVLAARRPAKRVARLAVLDAIAAV